MRGLAAFFVVLGFVAGPGAVSASAFTWSVNPPVAQEGAPFTISVTRGVLDPATATIATGAASDTASKPEDYTAPPGTLTWGSLEYTTKTATIPTVDDQVDEPDELLTVTLSSDSGPVGSFSRTIADNDATPTITIGDANVVEGTGPTPSTLSFPLTLSVASSQDITVNYATADGTATSPADYTAAPNGTVTIPKGTTTGKIDVAVAADSDVEPPETLTVTLSLPNPDPGTALLGTTATATGTITNDDTLPTLSIAAPQPTKEGTGAQPTPFDFVISLSKPSVTPVTVIYSTADGTASAPADYMAVENSVEFAPGETRKVVPIPVFADSEIEADETFSVTLSDTGGLTATTGGVTAIIVDDDKPATQTTNKPAGTTTTTAVRDESSPRIKLSKISSSNGVIRVTVKCPPAERVCRGTLTVFSVPAAKSKVKAMRREVKLASSLFVIPGGKQARLTLRPSKRVARLLRQIRSVKATAHAVARDAAGNIGTAQSRGTVKGARR
jgi:hypothetical protein